MTVSGLLTFAQRRQLAELLINHVIVADGQVEIRYVLPTSPDGPYRPFCSCATTISMAQRSAYRVMICPETMRIAEISAAGQTARVVRSPLSEMLAQDPAYGPTRLTADPKGGAGGGAVQQQSAATAAHGTDSI